MALEKGSIYQNHIFNGSINSTSLLPVYAGLSYKNNNDKKAISKWLY